MRSFWIHSTKRRSCHWGARATIKYYFPCFLTIYLIIKASIHAYTLKVSGFNMVAIGIDSNLLTCEFPSLPHLLRKIRAAIELNSSWRDFRNSSTNSSISRPLENTLKRQHVLIIRSFERWYCVQGTQLFAYIQRIFKFDHPHILSFSYFS